MDTAKLTDYVSVKTSLEQLQQTLTHLDTVSVVGGGGGGSGGLYQGVHTSTITTDSVVSCVSSTLPASASNGKQICHNNNNSSGSSSNNNNNNNNVSMMERKKCHEQHEHDALLDAMNALPGHEQKSPCCGLTMTTPTIPPVAAVVAANDLARDPWYAAAAHHHHHHHHHHPHHPHPAVPHQPLTDELVMYTPGPPAPATIGKFGLDTSTEGYLNARYNVNVVKGVRHERTSSFFDSIPAVTHPYYRFPTTPPASILKKSDEESAAYCNNSSPGASATASLHLGHAHPHHHHSHSHPHFQHNTKVELADSTTTAITAATTSTQLSHHHAHAHHHHLHQQTHQHTSNLQHHHHTNSHHHAQQLTHAAHLPAAHASAFKFSPAGVIATSGVYSGIYQQQSNGAGVVGGGSVCELALASASATSSSNDTELKYESPYNSTISSTYPALRANMPVDSTTAVVAAAATSTDCDPRSIDQFYASNAISTSQTVTSQRRGSLQLWQFLVALLDEPSSSSSCIAWTGRGMEFKLIEPEEVARRWGIQKNRPAMNYDKLSRSLRYYYEKGIMQKVNGERYVYRFVCDPDALFNMAYGHLSNAHTKNEHNHILGSTAATLTLTNKSSGNAGGSNITSTLEAQSQLINSKSSMDFYGAASLHKFP